EACAWCCRIRNIPNTSLGSPRLLVNNGCQRSFFGPGTTSRQSTVRTASSGDSPFRAVRVSARWAREKGRDPFAPSKSFCSSPGGAVQLCRGARHGRAPRGRAELLQVG